MIMEKVVIGIGIILVHILDVTRLLEIKIWDNFYKPDIMFIFAIFFSLRKGELSGLWIGFLGGILADASLGGEPGAGGKTYYFIGVQSISYSMIAYLLGKFGRTFYNENFVSIMIFTFILTLMVNIIIYFLFGALFHKNLNYSIFGTSIYNAAIAPLSFFLFSWMYRLDTVEAVN